MARAVPGPELPRRSAIYTGHVTHSRRGDVTDRFRYPLYFASIDLDELPALARDLRLFGHDRRQLFALRDRDYAGTGPGVGIRAAALAFLAAHAPARPPPARVELLTQLRVFDYVFNPVSFFLCWSAAGTLDAVIAEVNNNWGGNHRYLLDAGNRLAGAAARFRTPKVFFVSPMIQGAASYVWHVEATGPGAQRLAIRVDVHRPGADGADGADGDLGERFFVAHLAGERHPLDDRALARLLVSYPLMTVKIIGLIHWHALRLYLRGVPYRAPGPDHAP
jgi:DUF1365 family protein